MKGYKYNENAERGASTDYISVENASKSRAQTVLKCADDRIPQ